MLQNKLSLIAELHPDYTFIAGSTFRWNPVDKIIEYDETNLIEATMQLLVHEIGHAELHHTTFSSDLELVRKEVAAWEFVRSNAYKYKITYEENRAEQCLDSYRIWLDQRSTCPDCEATGYQSSEDIYECINCYSQWGVSANQQARICRRQISGLRTAPSYV